MVEHNFDKLLEGLQTDNTKKSVKLYCGRGFVWCMVTSRLLFYRKISVDPHRAVAIRNYIAELRVARMKWPAQNTDVNPIENAWAT